MKIFNAIVDRDDIPENCSACRFLWWRVLVDVVADEPVCALTLNYIGDYTAKDEPHRPPTCPLIAEDTLYD